MSSAANDGPFVCLPDLKTPTFVDEPCFLAARNFLLAIRRCPPQNGIECTGIQTFEGRVSQLGNPVSGELEYHAEELGSYAEELDSYAKELDSYAKELNSYAKELNYYAEELGYHAALVKMGPSRGSSADSLLFFSFASKKSEEGARLQAGAQREEMEPVVRKLSDDLGGGVDPTLNPAPNRL
jgi:hypothetical protein